jgi:hypothetical protein
MSRLRVIAAGLVLALLAVLMGWQAQRERLVRACLDGGGAWDGAACGRAPLRPILQRDLHRS